MSDDDLRIHGASAMMYPDDVCSIGFSNTATQGGDGYCNNSNNVQATLGSSNSGTTEWAINTGFVKRQLCNPHVVSVGSGANNTVNPYTWATTDTKKIKTLCQNSGKGACVVGSGAANGSVIQIFYLLRIRLVDIHPIFKTLDLVANPQLKLTLYMNTGSAVITTDIAKNMTLTSSTLVQGNTCPFMLTSATAGSSLNTVLAANASQLTLAWGVMGNSLTTTATAAAYYPYSTCRLHIPFYDLQPEKQLQLVQHPKKVCRYLDYFAQVFKGQAGIGVSTTGPMNVNFSFQLSGTLKNAKYVAMIPFANTAAGNYASATNIDQYASPFDSAPWTCQAGSQISNFNVQVGNQWVFNSGQTYDFSCFLDEFVKIGTVYGGLEHSFSNGLIDEDRWSYGQRILVADISRLTSKDVSQSILVSGTNTSAQGTDFVCLVAYEKSFELDRITGVVELV